MSEFDLLTDELFGIESCDDESRECLNLVRDALASWNITTLAVLDDENSRRAAWCSEGTVLGDSLNNLIALAACSPNDTPFYTKEENGDILDISIRLGGRPLPSGMLVARLCAVANPGAVIEELSKLLPWLRATGTSILMIGRQSESAVVSQARLRQLEQQHSAFRDEHLRIVEMNLEDSDDRLLEQRRYASKLEHEVAARTRDLTTSEAELRAIFNTAPDGIMTFNQHGIVESCNRAAISMFGYSKREVIGLHVSVLLGDSAQWILADGGCDPVPSNNVKCVDHEFVTRRRDGSTFPIHFTVSSMRVGRERLFTVCMRDVTELKKTEQLIRSQKDRLTTMNRVKSEFLANMSHEIRTPMTAILGFTDVLREKLDDPEQLEAVETIQRNWTFLLEIINDILDLSKIESGKIEVEKISVEPCQVVADIASLMRVRAIPKNLDLKVEFCGPIPRTIQSDPTRVRQILVNLVGNAIKFTKTGEVKIITQFLSNQLGSPLLQFKICDTGIGISEEQIERLFKPFSQADSSTTRRFGGSGLGLAICHRLTKMLGGEIHVKSIPGIGSTFTVTVATGDLTDVSLSDGMSEITQPRPKLHEQSSLKQLIPNCRILLAEDGPDNRRLITFLLKKAGAVVSVAENGQLAMDAALQAEKNGAPFDVVLMDMQMPVMDGYVATTKLREAGYSHPVIALTAHAMKTDRKKCLDAGCDEYTTKPIKRQELLSLIARHSGIQSSEHLP